jgi:hypothetical protein
MLAQVGLGLVAAALAGYVEHYKNAKPALESHVLSALEDLRRGGAGGPVPAPAVVPPRGQRKPSATTPPPRCERRTRAVPYP